MKAVAMTVLMKQRQPRVTHIPARTGGTRRRLYYGWIMLPLATAAHVASSPGQTFGVSIFNEPMRASLGLSHGQLAAAYMLGTLLGALPIALIGHRKASSLEPCTRSGRGTSAAVTWEKFAAC